MQHTTWTAIESSPRMMSLYRSYRRWMPGWGRSSLRWLLMPRWNVAVALVRRRAQGAVLAGPFRGMRLVLSPVSERNLLGYVLGTHELELAGVLQEIIERRYAKIVNIGAADGYYSVGLLRRTLSTRVVAYEACRELHPGLWQAAAINDVADRLEVMGLCDTERLTEELESQSGRTLILADIEGAEAQLLDPGAVPGLRNVDILVETHDAYVPHCCDTLIERFQPSHEIWQIKARNRTIEDFPSSAIPWLARLMPQLAVALMSERRIGVQRWLYLVARQTAPLSKP